MKKLRSQVIHTLGQKAQEHGWSADSFRYRYPMIEALMTPLDKIILVGMFALAVYGALKLP
jgi:hypothetical protein